MAKLIRAIAHSVDPILNITCILGVIIYVFAVMGMRIFGPAYTPEKFGPDGVPRWNFKDFAHSFMMVFRILCSEWVEPLWDCMKVTSPAALFFFMPCLIVGNFIVSIWLFLTAVLILPCTTEVPRKTILHGRVFVKNARAGAKNHRC